MAHDKLFIRDLLVRCIIGINPEEREKKQDVVVNISLHGDLTTACRTDRIEDSIDYKAIKTKVAEMIKNSSYFLIERLANEIASICLSCPRVEEVTVEVEKPGALRFARTVGIQITRSRNTDG